MVLLLHYFSNALQGMQLLQLLYSLQNTCDFIKSLRSRTTQTVVTNECSLVGCRINAPCTSPHLTSFEDWSPVGRMTPLREKVSLTYESILVAAQL